MGNYAKPPLGAAPCYIRAEERVIELSEAIIRVAKDGGLTNYTGHVTLWAKEIIKQCEIANMEKNEKLGVKDICLKD